MKASNWFKNPNMSKAWSAKVLGWFSYKYNNDNHIDFTELKYDDFFEK
jgi:hypothetical protein